MLQSILLSMPDYETSCNYTCILVILHVHGHVQLTARLDTLHKNQLSCTFFSLIASPPAPSNFIISFEETNATTMSFNFTWDSTFNSVHAITSYRVIPGVSEGSSVVECPSSCFPNTPCRCIGLVAQEQVNVSISAINCGNQDGPIRVVTVSSSKFKLELHVWWWW